MLQKGQGAIEYLLIIAAAILVVAIVIIAVTGALEGGQDQTDTSEDQVFDAFHDLKIKGLGYQIEIEMADGSGGNIPYKPFPVDSRTDCNSPVTRQRLPCFYFGQEADIHIQRSLQCRKDAGYRQRLELYPLQLF